MEDEETVLCDAAYCVDGMYVEGVCSGTLDWFGLSLDIEDNE